MEKHNKSKDEVEKRLLDSDSMLRDADKFYSVDKGEPFDEEALLDQELLRDEIDKHHPKLPKGSIDLSFTDDEV